MYYYFFDYLKKFILINFIGCWDNEPDNRPTMNQVVTKLKTMFILMKKQMKVILMKK